MSEEMVLTLECDLCDSCEKAFTVPAYNPDGTLEEFFCSGLIPKPMDENDIHDIMNTIRICIGAPGSITSHEFTTWEASCVSVGMGLAVTRDLEHNQPTLARVEELIKLGYTDEKEKNRNESTSKR